MNWRKEPSSVTAVKEAYRQSSKRQRQALRAWMRRVLNDEDGASERPKLPQWDSQQLLCTLKHRQRFYEQTYINGSGLNVTDRNRYEGISTGTRWALEDLTDALAGKKVRKDTVR